MAPASYSEHAVSLLQASKVWPYCDHDQAHLQVPLPLSDVRQVAKDALSATARDTQYSAVFNTLGIVATMSTKGSRIYSRGLLCCACGSEQQILEGMAPVPCCKHLAERSGKFEEILTRRW